ncbi:MAG: Rpp14/Pop5 family protein [archaeon]|nr:Rpp14/Pop5 family protein [archaeon]
MKLLPSLKERKRYVLFKIDSKEDFTAMDVKKAVDNAIKDFIGELGISKASPMFLSERYQKNQFIVKVNHKFVNEVVSAIILIKKIKNTPVLLQSVIISGTLKKVSSYIK